MDAERGREAWIRGHEAEERVAEALVRVGVDLLARNWRGGGGELDLVVRRAGKVRFVEVKARTDDTIDPLESIGAGKRSRLVSAARAWLQAFEPDVDEVAFLVAVVDCRNEPWSISWVDDAFDAG